MHWCMFNCIRLFATPWIVAWQAPLSMGRSRQEHWSALLFTPPGWLPTPKIKPESLMSSTRSRQIPYKLSPEKHLVPKKTSSPFCPFQTSFLITTKLLKWNRKPNLGLSLVEAKAAGGLPRGFHDLIHRGLCVTYQNCEFQEQRNFLILLNLLWNCFAESHFLPFFIFRLHFFFFN